MFNGSPRKVCSRCDVGWVESLRGPPVWLALRQNDGFGWPGLDPLVSPGEWQVYSPCLVRPTRPTGVARAVGLVKTRPTLPDVRQFAYPSNESRHAGNRHARRCDGPPLVPRGT